jgi:hypothetical protein
VLRLYGWWSAEGPSELTPDKQVELRVLGYREVAMLNVATPGIILGLIASFGRSHLDAALKVAADRALPADHKECMSPVDCSGTTTHPGEPPAIS